MWVRLGERPPWTQKILPATIEAIGRQLKTSMKVFQILIDVRRLHSS